jgi:hypothetical protein
MPVSEQRLKEIMEYCQEKQLELGMGPVVISISSYPEFFMVSVMVWGKDERYRFKVKHSKSITFANYNDEKKVEKNLKELKNFLAKYTTLNL